MKLVKSLCFSLLMMAVSITQLQATVQLDEKVLNQAKQIANEIGIADVNDYLRAIRTYHAITAGIEQPKFKSITDFNSYGELGSYIDSNEEVPTELNQAFLAEFNHQRAMFATQLGLEVKHLDKFLKTHYALVGGGEFTEIMSAEDYKLYWGKVVQ